MKNGVLKTMRRCTDKLGYGQLGDIVLSDGTLYASDRYVAVRYKEDWGIPQDVPQMVVPDQEITTHKANQLVNVCDAGFSWDGAEFTFGEGGDYPCRSIDRIFDDAAKQEGKLDGNKFVDPKLLANAAAVFEAAGIDMKVKLSKHCLVLVGYKFEQSRCVAALSAIVMCKVVNE